MEDARKWLGRARMITRQIEVLKKSKVEAREQLERITQNYNSDGAQSTKDPHKFDRLAELDSLIDQKIDELNEARAEITKVINSIHDGRQHCVLYSYYIRCKTLEEIAVETHYSYRHVKRFHRNGIDEVERMLNNAE